jgi:hypothetical protein
MALLPTTHRFKVYSKIELRFDSRVWFGLTNTRCLPVSTDTLGVLPPRPRPRPHRPLDPAPAHCVDLDLTANDPRVRPDHVLSLILVAAIQARRNCRQLRLGEFV